ncbi:alkaline phosphatase family protein [Cronbergia sp. UHCC 0137]|uniref:alkaline phosphatase family protein n=1 Tax=Cronbergia sp. UHCC 0137 TaxID=3110239 RepID=UPI002B21C446|nr:alkaline phosphatase family protein [Cronbergia sp. UHCC 0137]MEA5619322.1 alkaline phosphatase family protein [Cronbergia sp. UHCC 0137]
MKNPILAIGLDATDPVFLEKWMDQGYLKNLNQLRSQGIYGRLHNTIEYNRDKTEKITNTECLWTVFNTGCLPNKTGYWSPVKYSQENYTATYDSIYGGYNYQEYLPFYALPKNKRIGIFDVPLTTLCHQVQGLQVLGWGGHNFFTPRHSLPSELFAELAQKHSQDLIYQKDTGIWWDKKYQKWLPEALKTNIARRSAICQDLLSRESWDLFLTVFTETHTAGHDLYNRSQPDHPLYSTSKQDYGSSDVMLEVYQQIDHEIGEIISQVSENTHILIFSVHGMEINNDDLFGMLFLPELMYRLSFPGKTAIAPGHINTPPPAMITHPVRHSWLGEVWARNTPENWAQKLFGSWTPTNFLHNPKNGLDCPFSLLEEEDSLAWMPTRWYQPLWHQMKAFALPVFTGGDIRLNLKGRESQGIVELREYDQLCNQITQYLFDLRDGRTGKPIVKDVIRTRPSPMDNDTKISDGDLAVIWHELATDVIDSPDFGRIGPVPYFRPGGHTARGFLMAKGPGITPNSTLEKGSTVDLSATILNLMNVPIPDYFDGKPLLNLNL